MVITATDLALRASEQEALGLLGLTDSNPTTEVVAGSSDTLYDLSSISLIVNSIVCYGSFSQRDTACKSCMASALCKTAKSEDKERKKANRIARLANDAKYEKFGMTASQVARIPKYVREAQLEERLALAPWECKLTQRSIKAYDKIVLIHGYGICLADVIEIL